MSIESDIYIEEEMDSNKNHNNVNEDENSIKIEDDNFNINNDSYTEEKYGNYDIFNQITENFN